MKSVINLFCCLLLLLALASCSKDDPIVLPKITIDDVTATEGSTLLFTVTVDKISRDTIKFNYKTEDGTATTSDYYAVSSDLTGKILPGETSVKVNIPTKTDAVTEGEETMKIIVSSPIKAVIQDGEGIGTIMNKAGAVVTYFMRAKINGAQWTARIGGFFGAEFIGHTFAGYGTDNDSQLSFVFENEPTGAKTYGLEELTTSTDANVSAFYSPTFFSGGFTAPTYNGQPGGEFKITSYNLTTKIAEGTFSFTAKTTQGATVLITEGTFKVPIAD